MLRLTSVLSLAARRAILSNSFTKLSLTRTSLVSKRYNQLYFPIQNYFGTINYTVESHSYTIQPFFAALNRAEHLRDQNRSHEALDYYDNAINTLYEASEGESAGLIIDDPDLEHELLRIGKYLVKNSQHEMILKYFNFLLYIDGNRGVHTNTPYACLHLANTYLELDRVDSALQYAEQGIAAMGNLSDYEKTDNERYLAGLYEVLGLVYKQKKDLGKAQEYLNKALDLYLPHLKETGDELDVEIVWKIYQGLGEVSLSQYAPQESLKWYEESLEWLKEHNFDESHFGFMTYANVGDVYRKMNAIDTEQLELALEYYKKAKSIADKVFGPKDRHFKNIYQLTAKTLEELKRVDESIDVLIDLYGKMCDKVGCDRKECHALRQSILHSCKNHSKPEKLEALEKRVQL